MKPPRLLSLVAVMPTIAGGAELQGREFSIAEGYTLSVAAPSSLIERPVEACFDDKGRLYVTEVSGTNDPPETQLKNAPHRLLRVEDTDGDGVFDQRVVFADKLGFPEGVLWHEGAVYVSAPPQIWKFTDADGDGSAEKREVWHDGKTLTGCANDLHGPYAGPDGFLYWCKGAFAEQPVVFSAAGQPEKSTAAHVFRMRPDGTGLETVFTAGMDNPVGLAWLPEGDMIVSGTFLQHPGDGKRDGLIHAVRGGVWGKDHAVLDGHLRTGALLPAMTHLGPAAPCGMIRYGRDLLVCQFNLRKVSRHALEPEGATWRTADSDFLSCDDPDFHPTDVLQAPDGSVLVVDTGGWYKLCCPTSQVAKPEVTGAIYRLRKTGGEIPTVCPPPRRPVAPPATVAAAVEQLKFTDAHLRRTAAERIGELASAMPADAGAPKPGVPELLRAAAEPGIDRFLFHALCYALFESGDTAAMDELSRNLPAAAPRLQEMAVLFFSQRDAAAETASRLSKLISSPDGGVRDALVMAAGNSPVFRAAVSEKLGALLQLKSDPAPLRAAVESVAGDKRFHETLGQWLTNAGSDEARRLLLDVMAVSAVRQGVAVSWIDPLFAVLKSDDADSATRAAGVLAAKPPKFTAGQREKLASLLGDARRPADARVALVTALNPVTPDDALFDLLLANLRGPQSNAPAAALAGASLTPAQLSRLALALPAAPLLARPVLLRAFSRATDEALGMALVEALEKANALAPLSAQDVAESFAKFPETVRRRLAEARAASTGGDGDLAQRIERLDELERTLPEGDARRGAVVFQSPQASCALCHQAGYFGKAVGPDLSKIGGIRTRRDLLEAIAFPSAAFVRSYEPVEVRRKDGGLAYGMVKNQNAAGVTLVTGAVTPEITVPAAEIDSLHPGAVSLMPQGIDQILSPRELADLVAFLGSLK